MAKRLTLPALKAFVYDGQDYRRGDMVAMGPLDAVIHARHGHVSLTRTYATRQLIAERPLAKPEPRRRRRARKRQMLVEAK